MFAIYSGSFAILWLWLAIAAIFIGGLSYWIVTPVGLILTLLGCVVGWWAMRRRAKDEPAIILDEVGIYDNISIVKAGRLRWRELERVWVTGPDWLRFICVLPEDINTYLEKQEDWRRLPMRFNKWIFGAPVVVPMAVLDMPSEDLWRRLTKVEIAARATSGPSNMTVIL